MHYQSIIMIYSIEQLTDKVNQALDALAYNYKVENLYLPIKYTLDNGGKRIRPVLMMMAYNMYRDDVERILPNALAMEVYHNFTLLHDDVMDKAMMRRGKPCVHVKWDENTAILSGDTMLAMAYQLMTENAAFIQQTSPDEVTAYFNAMATFNEATIGVCEGQQFDMDFESMDDVSEAQYMEMIRLKTSLLLSKSLKIGAQLALADGNDAMLLHEFGEKIGLAFQLQDDLLDVYGDPAVFGKAIGGDITSNKKTFMLIKTLEMADTQSREELEEWISKLEFDKAAKIKAVVAIYDKVGIKELCQKKIEELFAQGMDALNKVRVEEQKKAMLYDFANRLLKRKS